MFYNKSSIVLNFHHVKITKKSQNGGVMNHLEDSLYSQICNFFNGEIPAGFSINETSKHIRWGRKNEYSLFIKKTERIGERGFIAHCHNFKEESRTFFAIEKEEYLLNKKNKNKWEEFFYSLPRASKDHPYIQKKELNHYYQARVDANNNLFLPVVSDSMRLTGLQEIKPNGEKKLALGTVAKGSFIYLDHSFISSNRVFIAEGFATAATVQMLSSTPCIAAISAGNMIEAAKSLRKINPNCFIIFAGDHDAESKTGQKTVKKAINKIDNSSYVISTGDDDAFSMDFNDLFHKNPTLAVERLDPRQDPFILPWQKEAKQGFSTENKGRISPNYYALADYFVFKHKPIYKKESNLFFFYSSGVYRQMHDIEIKSFIDKHYAGTRESHRNEFLALIRAKTSDQENSFKTSKDLINFKNCVLNIKTKETRQHSHKDRFFNQIESNYDPSATCPTWDELVKNIFQEQNKIDCFHEFIGFALSELPYSKFNKILVLDGEGANGKTTIINCVRYIFGENCCGGINLTDLQGQSGAGRFQVYELFGKKINTSEEESKKCFTDTGIIKRLTGGSQIFADIKGKPGFSFVNNAKLITSYNEMPLLSDKSIGMKRRLMIIKCEQNYEKNKHLLIKDVEEKTKSEASGVINRFLEGLYRLVKNKEFTDIGCERYEEMRRESDPVYDFYKDSITITNDKEEFYSNTEIMRHHQDHYGDFISKVKQSTLTKRILSIMKNEENYQENFPYSGSKKLAGKTQRGLFGIKID